MGNEAAKNVIEISDSETDEPSDKKKVETPQENDVTKAGENPEPVEPIVPKPGEEKDVAKENEDDKREANVMAEMENLEIADPPTKEENITSKSLETEPQQDLQKPVINEKLTEVVDIIDLEDEPEIIQSKPSSPLTNSVVDTVATNEVPPITGTKDDTNIENIVAPIVETPVEVPSAVITDVNEIQVAQDVTLSTPATVISEIINLDDDDEMDNNISLPEKEKSPLEIRTEMQEVRRAVDSIKDKLKETTEKSQTIKLDKECINLSCKKNSNVFVKAPTFTLSHYRVNKKNNKKQFVCDTCYDEAQFKFEELCTALVNQTPIIVKTLPFEPDLVEISDSDEDENVNINEFGTKKKKTDEKYITNHDDILSRIDNMIIEAFRSVDIDQQLQWSEDVVSEKIDKNEAESQELASIMKKLQKKADFMNYSLYQLHPSRIIKELPSIDLNNDDCLVRLPKIGRIIYPMIATNKKYLAPRNYPGGAWITCEIMEIYNNNPLDSKKRGKYCKVLFCRRLIMKTISAKNIADHTEPEVRLMVGTRVVAVFQQNEPVVKNSFFPGIVGEPLCLSNKYRYLIFFDDGYCQYVRHENVRLICEVSNNVCDDIDINPGTQRFIQDYLSQYRIKSQRPMIQAKKGAKIVTEINGIWKLSKIVDVDCNLIKIFIEDKNTHEWIYRGSSRFAPIYKYKDRDSRRQHSTQNYQTKKRNDVYIEFVDFDNEDNENVTKPRYSMGDTEIEEYPSHAARSVAKKSTTASPIPPAALNNNNTNSDANNKPTVYLNNSVIVLDDDKGPKGKVIYFEAKRCYQPRRYIPHKCKPGCLFNIKDNLEPFNPIARPLLCGWERQICKTKTRKIAMYRAPCGKRLRNMMELHRYLRITRNPLNVECFDYDTTMHCLAEYVDPPEYIRNTDLSNGLEKMPISCCNYFDETIPPSCIYSNKRVPTEGVDLNIDQEFLCGCDCEDDCLDKSKCQCWQLTITGAKFGSPNISVDDIGYCYKRLPNQVQTGIYECNPKCKCSKDCLNRVVQHPLSVKLQVFKTTTRGWGLRTLHDIPKGSFICIYAGDLLTEQLSNEYGAKEGDEYFAELDYIEVVERLKEGYESDVPEEEVEPEQEDRDYEYEDENKNSSSDDEEFKASIKEASVNKKITTRSSTRRRNGNQQVKNNESSNDASAPSSNTKDTAAPIDDDCITISDDEDNMRLPVNFMPNTSYDDYEDQSKYKSVRKMFGKNELGFVMDAKRTGNVGRYFNHSCNPNLFVQNVFVDTHDLRFPWVSFFSSVAIQASTELTWNYNYDVGCVPGKVLYCQCESENCRGRLL